MPSSDKNTKVNKTQLCSELYLQSRGRDRPDNISQLNVMTAMTGTTGCQKGIEKGHLM